MQNDERTKELIEKIKEGISKISNSDDYKKYLKTVSSFHNYSARNTLLIFTQKENATQVAGFETWRKLNRHVKRGENGIAIMVPSKSKYTVGINKLSESDEATPTEKEIEIVKFRPAYVFDISQTDGEPLKSLTNELNGNVINYENIYFATKMISDCKITFEKLDGSKKGYFSPKTNSIHLDYGMSDAQTLKTLFHEIAHSVLHKTDTFAREIEEVQAESVAFILSDHFGLDTSEYSFPYITDWGNELSLEEIQSSLQAIQTATNNLITAIDESLSNIQKEVEIPKQISNPTLNERLISAKVIQEKTSPEEAIKSEQQRIFKRG